MNLEREVVAHETPPEAGSPEPEARRPPFVLGANLPWLQYGCDFGANAWQPDGGVGRPEQRARLRASFARLTDRGLTAVRWFVFCDGRAGVRFDAPGLVRGLDDMFWRDLEAGVEEASRAGIVLVPVLFDFPWCRRARHVDGVVCGGHRRAFASLSGREALIDRLVVPLVRRCAAEPSILAWDLFNEPEWVTRGAGSFRPFAPVGRSGMRDFVQRAAAVVHAESKHLVTVGLASARGLGLVKGLGLDVYQVHWYDRRERRAPLERPVAAGLDRPLWLGEFPTAGSRRTTEEIVARLERLATRGRWPGRPRRWTGGRIWTGSAGSRQSTVKSESQSMTRMSVGGRL